MIHKQQSPLTSADNFVVAEASIFSCDYRPHRGERKRGREGELEIFFHQVTVVSPLNFTPKKLRRINKDKQTWIEKVKNDMVRLIEGKTSLANQQRIK